jgi:hypothetical protein
VTVPFHRLWTVGRLHFQTSPDVIREAKKARAPGSSLRPGFADFSKLASFSEETILIPQGVLALSSAPLPRRWFGRFLCPQSSIRLRADRQLERLRRLGGRRLLGVQIRTRHTTELAAWRSPVGWFADQINELTADDPDGWSVFLSVDDWRIEADFRSRIHRPDRLISQPKRALFGTDASMEDALVDAYVLAESDLLLAPCGSSAPTLVLYLRRRPGMRVLSADGWDEKAGPHIAVGLSEEDRRERRFG